MPNYFDQFDPSGGGNYFDRFDPGAKQPEESGDVVRGAKVAFGQTMPLVKGVVGLGGATLENAAGPETLLGKAGTAVKNWGLRGYEEGMQKLQPLQKDTDDITTAWKRAQTGDLGALVDWAQYGLGYAIGQGGEAMAMSLLGGAAGAALAPAAAPVAGAGGAITGLVAKGAVKDFVTSLIEKAVVKEANALTAAAAASGEKLAGEQAVKIATRNVATEIGRTGSMLAYGNVQELGSIYPDAEKEAAEKGVALTGADLARVWGWGLAAGGVEGLTDRLGVDVALGRAKLPAIAKGRVGNAALTGLAGAGVEGGTEAVQTVMEHLGAGQPVFDEAGIKDIINSAALGAIGGGAIGGGAALLHGPAAAAHPEPAAMHEAADAAFARIGTATNIDEAISAFNDSHLPIVLPKGLDAEGALARLERQRDKDVAAQRVWGPSTESGGLGWEPGAEKAEPGAAFSSQPAAPATQPSANVEEPAPFGDRVLTLREQLGDSRTRQQIRDTLGPEALNDVLYYAQRADDASLPGATSDRMLSVAEALVSRALAQPVAGTRGVGAAAPNAALPAPAETTGVRAIGLDTTPTGTMRVDASGRAAPEVHADVVSMRDRARAMAERRDGMTAQVPRGGEPGAGVLVGEGQGESAAFPQREQKRLPGPTVIDENAHQAAESPHNELPVATAPQARAGNYQLGHDSETFPGLDLSIENPEGSTRRDKHNEPPKWQTLMRHHYGYLKRTTAYDSTPGKKQGIDFFAKPGTPAGHTGPVFVIDQVDPKTGRFDEHKVMLGFDNETEAREAYLANYEPGWKGLGAMTRMDFDTFKQWAYSAAPRIGPFSLRLRADELRARTQPQGESHAPVGEGEPQGVRAEPEDRGGGGQAEEAGAGHRVQRAEEGSGQAEQAQGQGAVPAAPVAKFKPVDAATARALRERGEQVTSRMDAERRFSAGDRIFVAADQDEQPMEVTSVTQLQHGGYTPDQMTALSGPVKKPAAAPAASSASDWWASATPDQRREMLRTVDRADLAEKKTAGEWTWDKLSGGVRARIMAEVRGQKAPAGTDAERAAGKPSYAAPAAPKPVTPQELALSKDERARLLDLFDKTPVGSTIRYNGDVYEKTPASTWRVQGSSLGSQALSSSFFVDHGVRGGPRAPAPTEAPASAAGTGKPAAEPAQGASVPDQRVRDADDAADAANAGLRPIPGPGHEWGLTVRPNENVAHLFNLRRIGGGVTGAPLRYRLTRSTSFPGTGITGAPTQEVGSFPTMAKAIEAFKQERDRLMAKDGPKPADTATVPMDTSKDPASVLADRVAARLAVGHAMSWQTLFAIADEAYGGTQAEGKYTVKDAYDAMEAGMNRYVLSRGAVLSTNADPQKAMAIVAALEKATDLLPTQTKRTAEQDEFQQFSTPPAFSYAANWVASPQAGDVYLEPSAGIGGLAVFGQNAGATLVLNELSARRADLLGQVFPQARIFRENAEQLHNVLPDDVKPTVVVMNPPFSASAGRMQGARDTKIGAQHVEQALKRLRPGGRLVAIVGNGMELGKPTFADWWNKIQAKYDVRAVVPVEGTGYAKYGTTFGNAILVIDKTLPVAGRQVVQTRADDYTSLISILAGIRDDRPTVEPAQVDRSAERNAAQPEGVRPDGELAEGSAAGAREPGAGRPAAGEQSGRGVGDGSAASGGERGSGRPAGPVLEPHEPAAGGGNDAQRGEDGSAAPAGGPDSPGLPAGVAAEQPTPDEPLGELTDSVFESYRPQRLDIPGAKPHPGALVQSAAMASVLPPAASYKPNLPRSVITGGKLSVAQLEAVVYAGQAHAQILPGGERRGYFIGDGTGVGKGREISAIVLDNWRSGRKKHVWVSEKQGLMNDAKRDFGDAGGDPTIIFNQNKTAADGTIDTASGVLYTTYATLRSAAVAPKAVEGQPAPPAAPTRLDQLVKWLGPEFDGVIAFDEAHNAGNAVSIKGERGFSEPSGQALAVVELQKRLPKARVVYVSATGATEVSNLSFANRLGLWGEGTPFPTVDNFINAMNAGGLATMELVARDMKQMGAYIARSLSFDGVTYSRVEHNLSPLQRDIYDRLAEAWQVTLRSMDEALKVTGAVSDTGKTLSSRAKMAAKSAYWSAQQRFFNQIITSMQMPTVVDAVHADLKAGRAVVLQLVNTNEAQQERSLAKRREDDESTDLEDLDLTPRDQLMQMVAKSFPVQQYETQTDESGKKFAVAVKDAAGNPVQNKDAVAMRDRLLEDLKAIRVPDGPLEIILNEFGPDVVAEVTGRKQRVVRKPNDKGEVRAQVEPRGNSAARADADAFMADKKRILIFSDAGGTGFSFQADLTKKNQRKRSHYLIQPGWRANKAVQGLGRTHRTNQASAPEYRLAATDIPAHKRFLSSIARRLDQLGALTKGQRDTSSGGLFSEKDNLESKYATRAVRQLIDDVRAGQLPGVSFSDFLAQLGLEDIVDKDTGSIPENKYPPTRQFLNRMLSLTLDMQEKTFTAFISRMEEKIEMAAQRGELDTGLQTIRALSSRVVREETVHVDKRTGAETKYIELELTQPTRIYSFPDTRYQGDIEWVRNDKSGRVWAKIKSGTITRRNGAVVDRYRMMGTSGTTVKGAEEFGDGYTTITEDQARGLWEQENTKRPPTYTEREHMVVGAILPIWDRLADTSSMQVVRVQTSDGRRLLGRRLLESELEDTMEKLNVASAESKLAPADVMRRVLAGETGQLANGWRLKASTVSGEKRIEVTGMSSGSGRGVTRELVAHGAIEERINWSYRYFVPTGRSGEALLSNIFESKPLTRLGKEDGNGTVVRAADFSQVANNASGESAASQEAVNRVARERAAGQQRVLVDRDGTVRPLIGPDAVDQVARDGQVVAQRGVGASQWTVLSSGAGMSPGAVARAVARLNFADGWDSVGNTPAPSTAESAHAEVQALFGDKADDVVHVVPSVDGLPPSVRTAFIEAGGVAVTIDKQQIYIVADRTERGTVGGLVLHELGVHYGMDDNDIARLTQQIQRWAEGSGTLADMAREALRRGELSASTNRHEEPVAYMVQFLADAGINPQDGLIARFLRIVRNAIDKALSALGLNLTLTPQHVVDYAYGAAKMALSRGYSPKATGSVEFSQLGNMLAGIRGFDQTAARNAWLDATKSYGSNALFNGIRTQYSKAQNHPDTFGRVFNAVQDYIKDIATFAHAASDRAPDVLPKLESLADLKTPETPAADLKKAGAALWQGTLADKRVYERGELADMGLTPKQQDLYYQFRAAINQSLDDLGKSEVVRLAGNDGAPVAHAAMGRESLTEAAAVMTDFLRQQAEKTQSQQLVKLADDIDEKVAKIERLKAEGYAPLMRFGRHTLHVTKGGETLFFGMYESNAEANAARRALEADPQFKGADFARGLMSEEAYRLYSGIPVDALELFAHATGAEDSEVYQDFLRLTKNNRSALKRMIHREGIAGFNEDARRVLAAFVTSNARMASGNLHLGVAKQAAEAIPKTMGDLKDDAINLVQYVQDPQEEAQALRGLLFTNFIGGSVASAAVNLTQPITMTLPYLGQFGGFTKAAAHLIAAARAAALGTSEGELGAALARAEADGIVSPQEIHHLQAEAMGRAANPYVKKALFLWGSMFSLSEQFNRRVTFIAAWNTAREQQMADPFAFAEKAVIETQGLYNKGNKPNWARGPIGATVMTFKQFSIHYLEFLSRMWRSGPEGKKAVGVALAILALTAGAGGLPFADDLDDLIDTAAQALGYDFSSKKAKRKFIAETLGLGETAADVATRGLSALPGMPIDVSLRMGMGNLIPGTGALLRSNTDRTKDVLEFAGPAGSVAKNLLDAGGKALSGDLAGAGMGMAPLAVQNMAKAVQMWNTGEYRNTKGQKVMNVDAADAAMKFIGFQPAAVARESLAANEVQRSVALAKNVEGEIAAKWAQGLRDKDPAMVSEARADLAAWNEKNPSTPMRLSMQQVIQRVRQLESTRAERAAKSAPRELRPMVRDAFQ